jgi:hypothetical protein
MLAAEISNRYLYPFDLLVGIIGAEGSGKSTLIQGLFPGLELTNDDDGINSTPSALYGDLENDYFAGHSFHIDVRYELAFKSVCQIAEAVNRAILLRKRVIVEHFDLLYEALGYNAQVIFSIGEDLRVYRPTVFGPSPVEIAKEVKTTNKYRLMTHTAEDLTCRVLKNLHGYEPPELHSDVRHGFVIGFPKKPDFDIAALESEVLRLIDADLPVRPGKGSCIEVGEFRIPCTGKRCHVKSTREIESFRLVKNFIRDPVSREYLLVGIVGRENIQCFSALPPVDGRLEDLLPPEAGSEPPGD